MVRHNPRVAFRLSAGACTLGVLLLASDGLAQGLVVLPQGELFDGGSIRVLVTIKPPTVVDTLQADVVVPAGFTVDPQTITLSKFSGTTVRAFTVKPAPESVPSGDYVIQASANYIAAGNTVSEAAQATFRFRNREIALGSYLTIALVGLLIGYAVRIAVKVLSEVEPPKLTEETALGLAPQGPFTEWVRRNYYAVDAAVTMVLGGAVLISLARMDAPPAFATRWHTALIAGMTVGLLTNSELITRLSARLPARS